MLFGSKKKEQPTDKIILGMVLLHDDAPFDLNSFTTDLQEHTHYELGEVSGDNVSAAFSIDGTR